MEEVCLEMRREEMGGRTDVGRPYWSGNRKDHMVELAGHQDELDI
jgi:hypothetical protein